MLITRKWMMSLAVLVTAASLSGGLSSYADCQQHATKAKLLLSNFKQSA
jgi:hypothetical protein